MTYWSRDRVAGPCRGQAVRPERDERITAHSELHDNGLMGHVDEGWADLFVGYMYSPYGCNGMVIEVG